MSIYGTSLIVGDPDEDGTPGVVLVRNKSNHLPDEFAMAKTAITGARIPAWCVPGHGHTHENGNRCDGYDHPAAWYRLTVDFGPTDVVLDEDAVRALRDDLSRWLDLPKTLPSGAADELTRDREEVGL